MKQLQIIICIKQVPDPEGPAEVFKVDPESKKVTPIGIPPVISPFDENALEAALSIKDHHDAKITAISMGEQLAQPVLRKALGVGADELILFKDPLFKDLDSYSTAYVLSSAIRKIGAYDLILTGRQAGDWDFGVVGLLIGEILQIPSVNLARKVEIKDDMAVIEKITHDGYEIVKAPMPVLVTASSEIGELRFASLKGIQAARKKPIKIYNAQDLDLDPQKLEVRQIYSLFAPQNQRQCRFIEGESPQEKGENLAIILKGEEII